MKLKNSTDFPSHFLRRMVAWCCKQMDSPARIIRKAQFRNRHWGYHGAAWGSAGRILCSIAPANYFPCKPDNRPGMQGEIIADREECLIALTAHEIFHVAAYAVDEHRQRTRGKGKRFASSEQRTRHEEVRVLRLFRANREALLAAWSAEPAKVIKPKVSIQEQRALKVEKQLANWTRKLKLAQTKVKKLKARAKYYDGAIAAKSQPQETP